MNLARDYRQDPCALYIARTVTALTDHPVTIDPTLADACRIDHDRHTIRIQPDLPPLLYHMALSRAWLRITAPVHTWTPEWDVPPLVPAPRPPGDVVCLRCHSHLGTG